MSAHHYFKDFAYCDSGMIPWLLICALISRTDKSLKELIDERIEAFPCSGEINFKVECTQDVIDQVFTEFEPVAESIDQTDGISMCFDQWRFNLRASNTEPLLRLNVESRGDQLVLQSKLQKIVSIIEGH